MLNFFKALSVNWVSIIYSPSDHWTHSFTEFQYCVAYARCDVGILTLVEEH